MRQAKLDGADLTPLTRLACEAGSGEVSPEQHQQGKERLLLALEVQRLLPTSRPRWPFFLAAAAALALAVFFAWPRAPLGYSVEGGAIAEEGSLAAAPHHAATLRFTDGTRILLSDGARGRVAEVTAHGARVILEQGVAEIEVVHRPSATWSFEAGPFTVMVTGTAFTMRWSVDEEILDVRMREGSVMIRGPQAPQGIPLGAGHRLVAHGKDGAMHVSAAEEEARGEDGLEEPSIAPEAPPGKGASMTPSQAAASSSAPLPAARAAPSWAQQVAAGHFADVLADAESRGLETTLEQASLSELNALADAARYARRNDIARRALVALRARFPGSAEARGAAFLLGRIADAQGATSDALTLYDRYLAESPQGPFVAEALGRKMMVLQRTAKNEEARAIAEEYLRRYPQGSYAQAAKTLVNAP